ncbi:uncharacterized protein BX663DRAFT_443629 [Cokeromyces recurvatus]|uniref:uncharacterized protein n=1 Tax=Cokeromyces recurvatus TaxID=90255 RepID=UPI002220DAAC|nr:uncharacterized protein BX663DRAFT_443629 [Cokeromyces recurvatus]KAI7898125.1 hypothetical protein BX663DRAFT_443629 [Cokeromyces recurvatus]
MLLLILYYVYKWMTVPWSYYENIHRKRMIHQNSSKKAGLSSFDDDNTQYQQQGCKDRMMDELRRHELAGLLWVTLSPFVAGFTLQYSRYLVSNVEHYISTFNITVFILAASIKPLSHLLHLLQERTLDLHTDPSLLLNETSLDTMTTLENRIQKLEKEIERLQHQYSSHMLSKATLDSEELDKTFQRFDRRVSAIKNWADRNFTVLDRRMHEFDAYICYQIEQDQKMQQHGIIVSIFLLPFNISLWMVKRITCLLPTSTYHLFQRKSSNSHHPLLTAESKDNHLSATALLTHDTMTNNNEPGCSSTERNSDIF